MCDPNILISTKAVLKYLLKSNHGSHTIESLNDDFFNYVGIQIPYDKLGYHNLETFFQCIPDTLKIDTITKAVYPSCIHDKNIPQSSSGFSMTSELLLPLSNIQKGLYRIAMQSSSPQLLPPLPKTSSDQQTKNQTFDLYKHAGIANVPPIYTKDIAIVTTSVSTRMTVGKYYELYISEIYNPYKFWFQFDDDSHQLYDLQEQLNLFYNKSTANSQHVFKKIHMVKGHICAAVYNSQWHRAEIINEPEGENVKVFFVDYGTVSDVLITDVRYLLDCFSILPKLCFRGTLDFIKPTSPRWNREATIYFNDLISNQKLVAGVSEINSEDNSVRIYLMDKAKNINVNYMMVMGGHAFPDNPTERYKITIADAVPTFESLEKGEHPSLAEVGKYLEEGIDIEKMFQSNVIEHLHYFTPQSMSDMEPTEIIQKYYREKKQAKEIASKRDATMFFEIFGHMLNNPFLNGIGEKIPLKKMNNVPSRNPFIH